MFVAISPVIQTLLELSFLTGNCHTPLNNRSFLDLPIIKGLSFLDHSYYNKQDSYSFFNFLFSGSLPSNLLNVQSGSMY
jgi:hypothetical protein